jgi:CRISPR-associated protein Csd1
MILQALKEYYDRKNALPGAGIAPEGFEEKEFKFLVAITLGGDFIGIRDTREAVGKNLVGKKFLVPRSKGRSGSKSFETTFLLWDHIGYLFQSPDRDTKAANQHQTWLKMLNELPDDLKQDEGVAAVLAFYQKTGLKRIREDICWADCQKQVSCNMTFILQGDDLPVPCRPRVQAYVRDCVKAGPVASEAGGLGVCLVSGERGAVARKHGRTSIDKDTKSLVAFQKNAGYDSYGKEQCFNAPVSTSSEFAYVTGLNSLLRSKEQRIQIGNTTTIFWAEKDSRFEQEASLFFSEPPPDNPDSRIQAVRAAYDAIWNGTYTFPIDQCRFFILGLSPNSARISVRLWQTGSVGEIGARFKQHLDDLAILHSPFVDPALPIRKILQGIAPFKKDENIPPNLVGETIQAIITGSPYPMTLLQGAVRRIRAEQSKRHKKSGKPEVNVTYERAAVIKACLNRSLRWNTGKPEKEITMGLDITNPNIGYRLGRLFATLEKIQAEASPGLNATIRDRYYGGASGSPVTAFPLLMRLKNHHLKKISARGRVTWFERLIAEILAEINAFPPALSLPDQGRFAIGYYHQQQSFFAPRNSSAKISQIE